MVKSVSQQLREAKAKIKTLETDLQNVKQEREKFRSWFSHDFRFHIDCLSENKHWTTKDVIQVMAKRLASVEKWYW